MCRTRPLPFALTSSIPSEPAQPTYSLAITSAILAQNYARYAAIGQAGRLCVTLVYRAVPLVPWSCCDPPKEVRPSAVGMGEGSDQPVYSIGAVAKMLGMPTSTLRAWEERYGMVAPFRSPG